MLTDFIRVLQDALSLGLLALYICHGAVDVEAKAALLDEAVLLLDVVGPQVAEQETPIGVVLEHDTCSLTLIGQASACDITLLSAKDLKEDARIVLLGGDGWQLDLVLAL